MRQEGRTSNVTLGSIAMNEVNLTLTPTLTLTLTPTPTLTPTLTLTLTPTLTPTLTLTKMAKCIDEWESAKWWDDNLPSWLKEKKEDNPTIRPVLPGSRAAAGR